MTNRRFRIQNTYDDNTVVTEATLNVPTLDELAAEGRTWEDFVWEELFSITGTGRTEGDAIYTVDSIDGLDPNIHEEYA